MENSSPDRVADARASCNLDGAAATPGSGDAKIYRAKVFKSGNSLALRLPKALGLEAGMEMELQVGLDGVYTVRRIEAPRQGIDVSGFAGKCPWLKPLAREDFEERPSATARRLAQGGA